jgi:hypothetical protein
MSSDALSCDFRDVEVEVGAPAASGSQIADVHIHNGR